MIAYNNVWLNNLLVRDHADTASEANCISKAEKDQVYAAYPAGFYTPNIFVRIGLFILTVVIVLFALGLFLLIAASASETIIGVLVLFFGLLVYGGLELMINKRHYKSGVDDALLWMAASCVVGGVNVVTAVSWQGNAIIIFILSIYLFVRFTDAVMAAIASLAILAIIFLSLIKLGEIAKAITPFVLMISSAVIYFLVQHLLKKMKWKHYTNGFRMISITALVCLYAAGNYYVVREASIALFNLDLKEGKDIPLGWLFWIFTVVIPVIYIISGIHKKDAVLLRVGLLLVAAVVFTVRYYYHVLPAEIVMVIGGSIFIAIAYALIKYLHEPRYGFTGKEQDDTSFMDKLQAESLVIAQTFSGPQVPAGTDTRFGGGSGGGGGATGEF